MKTSLKAILILGLLLIPGLASLAQNPGIDDIEELFRAHNNQDHYQLNQYLKRFGTTRTSKTKKGNGTIYYNPYKTKNNSNGINLAFVSYNDGSFTTILRNAKEDLYKYYVNNWAKTADEYTTKDNTYFFKKGSINISTMYFEEKIYIQLKSLSVSSGQTSTKPKKASTSGTVTVRSTKLTGIYLNKGDKINLKASGRITLGFFAGAAGPEGINGFEIYNIVRNYRHGSLIATIGENGTWFYVGRKATLTADTSGYLKLYANDVDPGNNSGSFKVVYTKM
ncbi:hypothetical protein [uncultured Marixanthomonas sp.]|uniref:hypothetical protein n=1 Tax=uncultured Marixanthomonas sp. TaxID=757245 RepID=UPI0030D9C76B|tara:strand:- start:12884 stop:13723 length:840 start_codon:yes stop_codon:yes gene_type:complete